MNVEEIKCPICGGKMKLADSMNFHYAEMSLGIGTKTIKQKLRATYCQVCSNYQFFAPKPPKPNEKK